MNRRHFLQTLSLIGTALIPPSMLHAANRQENGGEVIQPLELTDAQWKTRLDPERYRILRQEKTEPPFTSPLLHEQRTGHYQCAGCELPLFSSAMKYDSGTGWPSFTTCIPGQLGEKVDLKLFLPRTEYHCIRCGGHQGHVFDDGPPPLGKRYCNNGLALIFSPDAT